MTDVNASPVIGPVVSSERITARNGARNSFGVTSSRSDSKTTAAINKLKRSFQEGCGGYLRIEQVEETCQETAEKITISNIMTIFL